MSEGGGARRIRLGMVGGGQGAFIGGVHRMAARLDDRFDLVAGAFSSNPERSRQSGTELGIEEGRSYDSYEVMADREAGRDDCIEAVAIVTPNHLHYPVARRFLEAGVHILCDKPLTTDLAQAEELAEIAGAKSLVFGVAYVYSGYPAVRRAKGLIAAGAIGALRLIRVDYVQGWLAAPVELRGNPQAAWRTDPVRNGPAGCLGDIGTHAFHLAEFVSGGHCEELLVELNRFAPGRQVDDDMRALLRFSGGAKGLLHASQIVIGRDNGLSFEIAGEAGTLAWHQETPDHLRFAREGQPAVCLVRGGPLLPGETQHVGRVPAGHPEGFIEAFGQIYADFADEIRALGQRKASVLPDVGAGLRGMRFIEAALASDKAGNRWTSLR